MSEQKSKKLMTADILNPEWLRMVLGSTKSFIPCLLNCRYDANAPLKNDDYKQMEAMLAKGYVFYGYTGQDNIGGLQFGYQTKVCKANGSENNDFDSLLIFDHIFSASGINYFILIGHWVK